MPFYPFAPPIEASIRLHSYVLEEKLLTKDIHVHEISTLFRR